jgi:hypothetical protein
MKPPGFDAEKFWETYVAADYEGRDEWFTDSRYTKVLMDWYADDQKKLDFISAKVLGAK